MGKTIKKTAVKATVKTTKTKVARKAPVRKATFTVKADKGVRIFTPVNKRAKKLAHKVGKRTRLTATDMKTIKTITKSKLCQYDKGELKAVRV